MKRKIFSILFLFYQAFGFSQVTSTFDTDADGWTFYHGPSGTLSTINHNNTNGNPGGYISATYASNSGTTQIQYWIAPAKYLGTQGLLSLDKNFKFDMQQSVAGTNSSTRADIRIISGSNRLFYSFPSKPAVAPLWSSYSLPLNETGDWHWDSLLGPIATRNQIISVLSNITAIEINGTYVTNAAYTSAIDNVVLEQGTLGIAPTVSSLSSLAGKPGSSITILGSGFGSTVAENEVYFGSVGGEITNASSTSLSTTVPAGAPYGTITVINKTTGLSKQSAEAFNPTFDGGGRIIPASFKSKIDITLDPGAGNNIRGLAVADIDGDGWNDILVAESVINSISIFRNLGTGGALSTTSFAPKVSIAGGGNGGGLRIVDLDGDGKQDIATERTTASATQFTTFRNTSSAGNISFESPEYWPGLVYSGSLSAIEDVDGDGRFDLLGQHGNGSNAVDFWIAQNISSAGNIEFGTSVSYFGSTQLDAGAGVTTGDLDNDGKPDFAVRHGFGNRFSIIKNNSIPGTISLGAPFEIVQSSNGGIVIADFNLDGKNDLAWKQGFTNDDVHIRLNGNTGGLLAVTDFDTEIILNSDLLNYGAISFGDINGDGKPDILTSDSRQIGVFENIYEGGAFTASSFIRSHVYEASGISTYPTGILPADLNGDSKPDLVVGITNTNPIRILIYENRNVAAPVISLNTVTPLKGEVGSLVTITGDNFSTTPTENIVQFGATKATVLSASKTELTVSVPSGASLSLVSVTRDNLTARYHLPFVPTFGPGVQFDDTHFAPPITYTLTTADYDIAVGDLNNDGKPDVLAEGLSFRAYSFLNTHTSGSITVTSLTANDTTVSSTQNPILIDIDEDGVLDIMSINGAYRNTGTASKIDFGPLTSLSSGSNHSIGDFNLDGKTDVLGANGTNISIAENRSIQPGTFLTGNYPTLSPNFNYTKPATGGGTAAADFDNDGWKDFAAANPGTDNVTVWRNNGEFRISTTGFTSLPPVTVGDNPGRIYEGDLDSDGKMDLVLYHGTGTTATMITVLHNQSTVGNITFNRVDFTIPGAATVAHISDLDGDGKPEIIVTSETTDQFFILKNTSTPGTIDATSFAPSFVTAVNNPRGLASGDLNADGKPEIIITSAPNSLLVFENLIPIGPTISINPQPTSSAVCDGETAAFTLTASGVTNLTYQWQKFDGSVFTNISNTGGYSGTTTATLTINTTGNFGAGDYRCEVKGDLAPDKFSNTATLTINTVPNAPAVTPASNCVPTAIMLSASGGTNGQYRWYDVATGGTALAGQVNSTFTTPVINTTTNYFVAINNGLCESTRTTATATIAPIAKPAVFFDPPIFNAGNGVNLCEGYLQKFSAPPGFSSYLWSNGETTEEITITTSGIYTVTVQDASGCVSPSSDPITVTVNPYPLAEITANGTQLTASSGDSYQWFHNGNPVSGATNQSYEYNVLEYGVYAVAVTENGCTATSNDYIYLITRLENQRYGLIIYPNPIEENLDIEFPPPYTATIFTATGKLLKRIEGNQAKTSINFNDDASGIYILQIKSERGTFYQRISKK